MNDDRQRPRHRDVQGRFLANEHTNWLGVHEDYRAGVLTVAKVAAKYGISPSSVHQKAAADTWVRRRPRKIDATNIMQRLLLNIEDQMNKLAGVKEYSSSQSMVLQRLCTTLDKVIAMRNQEAQHPQKRRDTREMKLLREKIAERVNELTRDVP